MFKSKSATAQKEDLEHLDMLQRIDKDGYFYALINITKLDLGNYKQLTEYAAIGEAERKITAFKERNFDLNGVPKKLDFEYLQSIHKFMFEDIYYFAGKLRDVEMQLDSITRFCSVRRLESEASRIFDKLEQNVFLRDLPKDKFVEGLADFMTDLNILHPFREGNGRSKRIFVTALSNQAGYEIDFSKASREEWIQADSQALDSSMTAEVFGATGRDTTYLQILLKRAVTPLEQSRALVLKPKALQKSKTTKKEYQIGK